MWRRCSIDSVQKRISFRISFRVGSSSSSGSPRALIIKPKLILADEPTDNLNSEQGTDIMERFTELNKEGVTIIQCTHSEKNAGYGRRIIHLLDGWVDRDEATG